MCVCVKWACAHILSYLQTQSNVQTIKKNIFFNRIGGKATTPSFEELIDLWHQTCHKQAHVAKGIGCRATKVEWGCEAGEFKEFSVCLPVKTKPTVGLWKYGWAWPFSSLLHSPQLYRFNLDFYNRALQLNSLATEKPDIVRCFYGSFSSFMTGPNVIALLYSTGASSSVEEELRQLFCFHNHCRILDIDLRKCGQDEEALMSRSLALAHTHAHTQSLHSAATTLQHIATQTLAAHVFSVVHRKTTAQYKKQCKTK